MTLEDNATATRRDIRTVFEASHVRIFHNKLVNNWYKCRAPHPPMVRMLIDASGFESITANPSITRRLTTYRRFNKERREPELAGS
jgi:hypothetical protein